MKRTSNSQPKEHMVALGAGGYTRVVLDMMAEIARLIRSIELWNRQLERNLPAARRKEIASEVDKATNRINQLDAFHTEATKFCYTPGLRSIGWALHSSPIQVSARPLGYTEDWDLIQIDPKMIDEETFLGNKVFVGMSFPWFCPFLLSWQPFADCAPFPSPGGRFTPGDLADLMYPHYED